VIIRKIIPSGEGKLQLLKDQNFWKGARCISARSEPGGVQVGKTLENTLLCFKRRSYFSLERSRKADAKYSSLGQEPRC